MILWLDDPAVLAALPPTLMRLVDRGLEVRAADPLGPHKKYFPAIEPALADSVSRLVTVDDDMLYPRRWLADLMLAAEECPAAIVAFRARRVTLLSRRFAPWRDWPLCTSVEPSLLNFAIGEAGVAYPMAVLHALKDRGRGFLDSAPRVDDIWLHSTAVSAGVMTRQVRRRSLFPLVVPGSQAVALFYSNAEGGNDDGLRVNYSSKDLSLLVAASNGKKADE